MSKAVKFSLVLVLSAVAIQHLVGSQMLLAFLKHFLKAENSAARNCVVSNCLKPALGCFADFSCLKTLGCIQHCGITRGERGEAGCAYLCEMTHGYENAPFESLVKCMLHNACFPQYPDDGTCITNDDDGVADVDDFSKISGDWWVIGGLNCGSGAYAGGYDWFPCQHARYTYDDSAERWINNVTYCGGRNNSCTTEFITTVANVSLPAPGIVRHDYTDAPLSPQQESWRIVSWPDQGDYMLMLWCGEIPVLKYAGGILVSRQRTGYEMPSSVQEELRDAARKFGLDYDSFCVSDNTWCPV